MLPRADTNRARGTPGCLSCGATQAQKNPRQLQRAACPVALADYVLMRSESISLLEKPARITAAGAIDCDPLKPRPQADFKSAHTLRGRLEDRQQRVNSGADDAGFWCSGDGRGLAWSPHPQSALTPSAASPSGDRVFRNQAVAVKSSISSTTSRRALASSQRSFSMRSR